MNYPKILSSLVLLWLFPFASWAVPEGPAPNTPEWTAREQANYAKTSEAPDEQKAPAFMQRLQAQSSANEADFVMRSAADPSWSFPQSGNSNLTPLCASWMQQCAGDPFRYPGYDSFYTAEADVRPMVFYDEGCARLSGRVWAPKGSKAGDQLPAVIIETGSIQAPEPLYWWLAQALVRQGYVVMSYDVRGQGRSDQQTPAGGQGSNADSTVFWNGLVNAIDFFRSLPVAPYPHNTTCAGTYPTTVVNFNPFFDRIDRARLGIVGHSLGATGVSVVQSYGAKGALPWPGKLDSSNPVKVIVAFDSLVAPHAASSSSPAVVARVPAMGQSSEYGIGGTAKTAPPDVEGHKAAFKGWVAAGLPVVQLTIQGSTHFEWSLIPTFPATSWCPQIVNGQCSGGYGRPLAEHYTVAWLDRWLKLPAEKGYADADTRLLADADWKDRFSFYSRAARNFASRDGTLRVCEDIRAGCIAPAQTGSSSGGSSSGGSTSSSSGSATEAPLVAITPGSAAGTNGRFGGGAMPLPFSLLALLLRRRRR